MSHPDDAVRVGRRRFLQAAAGALLLPACVGPSALPRAWPAYPFSLGVASGSPRADRVVLWTRLAPDALHGGGMAPEPVDVRWEMARDEGFRDVVRKGAAIAEPAYAHSLHVEVEGLEPARWYWYRFQSRDAVSPVGRTRTAPVAGKGDNRLRFAFASCQQYEQGWYSAHRHMAAEDLDLVVFLGDYIYESSWGRAHVRKHEGPEPRTLEQYRNRHACYKSDVDLQRCHASFPWILTWDDHEVANDYAAERSQDLDPDFLARRAAAYRAYYEHMPLPASARPRGAAMRLYERYDFGTLASFHVLDDRQYRSHHVCPRPGRGGSNIVTGCPARVDPQRTMLGREQEAWLGAGLAKSAARWNVLAQQTLMAQVDRGSAPGQHFWTDAWDGYPAARARLLESLRATNASNPLVIGGDVHAFWVCDLKPDFDDPRSPIVASEFVTTSITSQGFPQTRLDAWRAANPHVRLAQGERRGYSVMEITPQRCGVTLRTIADEKARETRIDTYARYVVESGRPGPVAD